MLFPERATNNTTCIIAFLSSRVDHLLLITALSGQRGGKVARKMLHGSAISKGWKVATFFQIYKSQRAVKYVKPGRASIIIWSCYFSYLVRQAQPAAQVKAPRDCHERKLHPDDTLLPLTAVIPAGFLGGCRSLTHLNADEGRVPPLEGARSEHLDLRHLAQGNLGTCPSQNRLPTFVPDRGLNQNPPKN